MNRFELLNENEEIMYEDANCFEPYPNDKIRLKLRTGIQREQLKQSIERSGILNPVIVMPSANRGKLTVIAGGNRVDIGNELGIKIPYQLKIGLTQEQADLICIDTNLLNRQHDEFLISELAFIIDKKYQILKHQGKNDNTSRNNCTKFLKEMKISRRTVQYYIRLTMLPVEILSKIDSKQIPFLSGVAISYLKNDEIKQLSNIIGLKSSIKPTIADKLKLLSQQTEDILDIERELQQINVESKSNFRLSSKMQKKIYACIPTEDRKEAEDIIIKALALYYNQSA